MRPEKGMCSRGGSPQVVWGSWQRHNSRPSTVRAPWDRRLPSLWRPASTLSTWFWCLCARSLKTQRWPQVAKTRLLRGRGIRKCIILTYKHSLTNTMISAFMKLKTKMGSLSRSSNMHPRYSQNSDRSLGWGRTSFLSPSLPSTMFRRFITSSQGQANRQASSFSLITKLSCSKPWKIVKKPC
jgi:hypothetical protein